MPSSYIHAQLLAKALDATKFGVAAWEAQSTGERLAVALVLNRPEWLSAMGYSIPEALERIGPDWTQAVQAVAKDPTLTVSLSGR